jgi:GntR family transcriptional regulator
MSLDDRSGRIRRDSPRLLTDQVADDIRADMIAGKITGRLPTEVELAAQYGVSRVTIRRTIAILVSEGLVQVIHGRGTFVAEP